MFSMFNVFTSSGHTILGYEEMQRGITILVPTQSTGTSLSADCQCAKIITSNTPSPFQVLTQVFFHAGRKALYQASSGHGFSEHLV